MGPLFVLLGCFFEGGSAAAQTAPMWAEGELVDSTRGDLNYDGVSEWVGVYDGDHNPDSLDPPARSVLIYRRSNGNWALWMRSDQAVYGRTEGGVRGDPWGSVRIERSRLTVEQSGGSNWVWSLVEEYRCSNDTLYLTRYQSTYGKICDSWSEVDFRPGTGRVSLRLTTELCDSIPDAVPVVEDEVFYEKGWSITFEDRQSRDIAFTAPRLNKVIWIASVPQR